MSALAFKLPPALEAAAPPEARGIGRDGVRLLVADGTTQTIFHAAFRELPQLLALGDLVVMNVSATLPAAIPAMRADGTPVRVHVATRAPECDQHWRVVELRSPDGARPAPGQPGEMITLPGRHRTLILVAPYLASSRLWLSRFDGPGTVQELMDRHGQPIRYGYVERPWPLSAYQNVYATVPGSAEMPSAGRPVTREVISDLVAAGVAVAPVTLHCGVSSPERHEPPFPEPYDVPPGTARLVNMTKAGGGRVIAVGTTVVRGLETVGRPDGSVAAGAGWTGLVIDPERGVHVVDGLITGWHEPEASHLQMLAAIAGESLLDRSYAAALDHGYLWHEFGDSHLILR